MNQEPYVLQSKTPFSESIIWSLNRDFYQDKGIAAWSDKLVPHHMTSNARVGKLYAELIFGTLKDLASQGKTTDTVYIMELGAGHGRLAFHILMHLELQIESESIELPPYCFVLSDIVDSNLEFFEAHNQFKVYLDKGVLDVAYFDAIGTDEIVLRKSGVVIKPKSLRQPILAIGNYFFDSIPSELFHIHDEQIAEVAVSMTTQISPDQLDIESIINLMQTEYHDIKITLPHFNDVILDKMLEDYRLSLKDSYLFFPSKSLKCIDTLRQFSQVGLILMTMDKGFHELHNLQDRKEPDLVSHGSFSLWVNFHALSSYCKSLGGIALFSKFSNFHLEIGTLFFTDGSVPFPQVEQAFEHYVNDFGPDDFNTMKKMAYLNISRLTLKELIALYRLSVYDSTFFITLLPRLKLLAQNLSHEERRRLMQTLHKVWKMYFTINEKFDLAYSIGGIFYDIGCYQEALDYFDFSIVEFGDKADTFFNQALCYYQLREDDLFSKKLKVAQDKYPGFAQLEHLEGLDMAS